MLDSVLNKKELEGVKEDSLKEEVIPNSLQEGKIRIGTIECKSGIKDVYYSTDAHLGVSPRVVIGPMGSGKSHYMFNMAKDVIKSGKGLVVIDVIKGCELSEAIKTFVPKDRLLEIDFTNPQDIQSFRYNELRMTDDMDFNIKMLNVRKKVGLIVDLVDSISGSDEKLTPSMVRYLYSAATIVSYTNSNATLKDTVDVLVDVNKRMEIIDKLDKEDKLLLGDEISVLKGLNNETKSGIKNYDIKIEGILGRISLLKRNTYTELAFNNNGANDVDFVEAINKRKVVLIKIPENKIPSVESRDFIANFYLSKIWLAKQLGDASLKTELFFDGIGSYNRCQRMMESILFSHRVFNFTPVVSMNSLEEYNDKCKNTLLCIGASFIMLSKCDEEVYNAMKLYLNNNGYIKEDLLNIEKYNALSVVRSECGYSAFMVKLPN